MTNVCKLIRSQAKAKDTIVCCGLDPDIERIPAEFASNFQDERAIVEFVRRVVDITRGHVCAYKIQKAFFDYYSGAPEMLSEVVAYIQAAPEPVPVILDCKIGDTPNTMEAYLRGCFDVLKVDAVVVNPYMGPDVWLPFRKYPSKAAVVLVRTSNPTSGTLQDALLENGRAVWQYILDLVVTEWRNGGAVMPVLSDTAGGLFDGLRSSIPNDMPVLLAGIGAQGGTGATVRDLVDPEGLGVVVNSSRALLYPYERNEKDWARMIENAVAQFKVKLNGFRR